MRIPNLRASVWGCGKPICNRPTTPLGRRESAPLLDMLGTVAIEQIVHDRCIDIGPALGHRVFTRRRYVVRGSPGFGDRALS
jgi:hypothetical protein